MSRVDSEAARTVTEYRPLKEDQRRNGIDGD